MALLYSAPIHHYYPTRRQQQLSRPDVVPVVIHGTTYYCMLSAFSHSRSVQPLTKSLANPSPAADPLYLSVAQSPRSVASSFAYNYSSSNINQPKSQNHGVYSHGDRNRRAWSKQNSRPPRMFNRGPLNNTTNGKHPHSLLIPCPAIPSACKCHDPAGVHAVLARPKQKHYHSVIFQDREDVPLTVEPALFWLPETEVTLTAFRLVWFAPWTPSLLLFSLHIHIPYIFHQNPNILYFSYAVALEKPFPSVPKPQTNSALPKTPAPHAMYNNPRNAAVNRVPVQPRQEPDNAVTRFDQEGDAVMTDPSTPSSHPNIVENTASLKAVFQSTKAEDIPAPEPLASTFLRNFLGRPLPFNIHDNAEADYVAHLISILSDPRSPAARLLIDWSPAFVLRLQQFMLVRSQGAAVEEIAKQAKERCAGYMNACKEGANPKGGRAWLAARELKKPQPRLHKHVLLEQHRKKLGCIGSQDFVDMLV